MVGKHPPHTHPSRPALASQQSNSVPSTPQHRARRDFGTASRSPSPRGLSGSHSPRSVISEANGPMAQLSKVGRPTCKYEVSYQFGKRRIQYDIGDAPLEDPPEEPKKSLDPKEDEKLSGDMRELYDRLLPSAESEKRRRLFLEKLERILHKEWPGNEFTVNVFGSSGNLLCTSDSDVDICIQTPMKQLESMHMLAAALDNNGMQRVICVPAKVPIVKIWDPEFELAADLNVNNTLALENTRMIKAYVDLDPRVRPLAMIIKQWARQRILNDAGIGGTLSSYAWICMILNFLQTRDPPILPSLHQRPHKDYIANDGTESGFDDDIQSMRGFGDKNTSTLGQLLFQFYRFYGFEFNYDQFVVSVRNGRLLTRKEKGWTVNSKDGQWRLCIEEPFNTTRNLGNSADSTAFRGIHLEIRSAFLHICSLDLAKLVEQYEYPAEEKPIFRKAPPVPKPILSAGPAPGSRKGGSVRNNRNGRGNNSGASSRRASSGATFGRNHHPFSSPPLPSSSDMFTDVMNSQLAQHWQMLGIHAGHLKAQLAYNQSLAQGYPQNLAQAQAQHNLAAAAHAQSVVQAGGSVQSRESGSNNSNSQAQRMFMNSISPTGLTPLMNPAFYPNIVYTGPMTQAEPMSHSVSQDGSRTNPPSPALSNSIPVRRGLQRTSVSNGTSNAASRSQSQPARGLPQNVLLPFPIGYDATGLPVYAMPDGTGQTYRTDLPFRYAAVPGSGIPSLDNRPKEYLGYYFTEPLHQQQQQQQQMATSSSEMNVPRSASLVDIAQRRDKGRGELQPLVLNGIRKPSRSPSPLGHARHYSTPLRSAPLPSQAPLRMASTPGTQIPNPIDNSSSSHAGGLLIVNGSSYTSSEVEVAPTNSTGGYPLSTPEDSNSSFFDPSDQGMHDDIPNSSPFPAHMYTMDNYLNSHETDLMHSPPANGLSLQNYTMESYIAATTGGHLQSFPAYVDHLNGTQSSPLQIQEEETVMSPTSKRQSHWQPMPPPKHGAKPTHSGKDQKEVLKTPGTKSVPLLSPVIENRTPSPAQPRNKAENTRPAAVNGHHINGVVNSTPLRASEPVPPTPASSTHASGGGRHGNVNSRNGPNKTSPRVQQSNSAAQTSKTPEGTNSGSWQTSNSNRARKNGRKRAKSGPSPKSNTNGAESKSKAPEPLPARVEDRKGG